jgi:hypothetical protein
MCIIILITFYGSMKQFKPIYIVLKNNIKWGNDKSPTILLKH